MMKALTYDDRAYDQNFNYPSIFSRRSVIPAERDSVINRNEFLPSISNRVDRRGNFAWID